jgi:5'-methylthioadenosine phosphorylase
MKLGVIGGSGLYELDGLDEIRRVRVKTPFGPPSDAYIHGRIGGREIFFLPRHGRGHRLLPSEINHKANIYGFKALGIDRIVSFSAVGSLKEELRPRDIVLPDQYFDRTKGSLNHTFFGKGIVAHVSFADPACPELRRVVARVARRHAKPKGGGSIRIVPSGTYVNMEGPAFSTRAESMVYRRLRFDVIGMTSLPEAKLSREAEICYQSVAMVTDYDCWHESEEDVTVEMIVANLTANVQTAKAILRDLVAEIPATRGCGCGHALATAVLTGRTAVPKATRKALAPIIGKYL